MITNRHVHVNEAPGTLQFWLLWGVLCTNVTAGIAMIAMAMGLLCNLLVKRVADRHFRSEE
jgi:hypothetical protein